MTSSDHKISIELLKEIKLFKSFNESELNRLIAVGEGIQAEAHSNIVIEGEMTWGLYVILEGNVGVLKANKLTGTEYDVGQLKAGSFFGEMSLVDDNPRSATVRALTDSKLFYLSKDTFLNFLGQSDALKLNFYMNCVSTLIHRLRDLDDNYVISQYQLWQNALKREESNS